jgi:hypothetical protein
MAIPQTSKRFSKLPKMEDREIDKVQERETDTGKDYSHADAWAIGVDSLCRNDGTEPDEGYVGEDKGTVFIPMSRIAMRDSNGKIPASMLPSHIDDMMYGELTFSSSAATFVEHFNDPDGTEHTRTYVSPDDGTHPVPPENIIYCDTIGASHTDLQYRYDASIPVGSKFGFMEVPGSRALTSTYGIDIVPSQSNAEVTVNAKYPKQFIGKINTSTQDVSNEPRKFGNLTLDMNGIRGINATVGTEHWTFTGLIDTGSTEYIRYHMNIELKCWPSQGQSLRTADIITLKIVRYTNAAKTTYETMSSCRYDMSSLADNSDPDIIKFAFDFVTNANTESFAILGEQNQQVTVSVNRVSLVELL